MMNDELSGYAAGKHAGINTMNARMRCSFRNTRASPTKSQRIVLSKRTASVFCFDMVGWLILRGFVGERLILKGFVVVVVLGFMIVNVC